MDVQALEQQVADLENNWKRALADYANLQKRMYEERSDLIKYANTSLIAKILPVLDNLELVQKHSKDMGLDMIIKELKQTLLDEGVEEILVEDKDFDSLQMDAIDSVEGPAGKVVEIAQKGYLLKGKVLRPARVKVGRGEETLKEEN